MNILCATDNRYAPYCGIMLTSLIENNRDSDLHIYILASSLDVENKAKFSMLSEKYKITIDIVDAQSHLLHFDILSQTINPDDNLDVAAYYRLLAPVLLPRTLERVMYLDVDMIVTSSLQDLYNLDFGDNALVASKDVFHSESHARLGLRETSQYFNSGMLLINLKYWREHNLVEKFFEYIKDNSNNLIFHDQDVLNAVLQGKVIIVPIKYNFQTGFIYTHINLTPYEKKEVMDTISKPYILHFTRPSKPWIEHSAHPYKSYYLYYRKISLWKDFPLIKAKQSFKDKIIQCIYGFLCKINIKKRFKVYIVETQNITK